MDDICKEKVNQDIFKAQTLNKVNSKRLVDLEKFTYGDDMVDKVGTSVYDFLNRES